MTDTLLNRIPRDQLPAGAMAAWDKLNELTARPTFVEVFAAAPELLEFVMGRFYGEIFFGGRVDIKFKQLARLRLSLLHGCKTCNLQNVPGVLDVGYESAQVEGIAEGDYSSFTGAERAVLELTDRMAMTNPEGALDADLHQRLAEHFDDAQLCELGVVMAVISGMAKLAFVFDLVDKEPYCPFSPGPQSGGN